MWKYNDWKSNKFYDEEDIKLGVNSKPPGAKKIENKQGSINLPSITKNMEVIKQVNNFSENRALFNNVQTKDRQKKRIPYNEKEDIVISNRVKHSYSVNSNENNIDNYGTDINNNKETQLHIDIDNTKDGNPAKPYNSRYLLLRTVSNIRDVSINNNTKNNTRKNLSLPSIATQRKNSVPLHDPLHKVYSTCENSTYATIQQLVKYDPQMTSLEKCKLWMEKYFINGSPRYKDEENKGQRK